MRPGQTVQFYDAAFRKEIQKGNIIFSYFKRNKTFFRMLHLPKKEQHPRLWLRNGYFADLIYKKGYRVISGCDVAEQALRYARTKNRSITYALMRGKRAPFKNEMFDAIFSFDVIEHISDVDGILPKYIGC